MATPTADVKTWSSYPRSPCAGPNVQPSTLWSFGAFPVGFHQETSQRLPKNTHKQKTELHPKKTQISLCCWLWVLPGFTEFFGCFWANLFKTPKHVVDKRQIRCLLEGNHLGRILPESVINAQPVTPWFSGSMICINCLVGG